MRLGALFGEGKAAVSIAALSGTALVVAALGLVAMRGDNAGPDGGMGALVEEPGTVQPEAPAPAGTSSGESETAAAEAGAEAEAAAGPAPPEPPRFDQVRVAPDGAAVVAGRAPVGSDVSLMTDGQEISVARAAVDGGFAAIFTLPPSDVPRIMSLVARMPSGEEVRGVETVIIAPFGNLAASETDIATDPDAVRDVASADVEQSDMQPSSATAPGDPADAVSRPRDEVTAPDGVEDQGQATAGRMQEAAAVEGGEAVSDAAVAADAGEAEPPAGPGQGEAGTRVETVPVTRPEVAEAEGGSEPPAPSGQPDTPAAALALDAPSAPDVETPSVAAPGQAPSIVIAGPDGLRVIQREAPSTPDGGEPSETPRAQTRVRLDAIAYDLEGGVVLSGRGPAEARIQILLNNRPIELGEVGPGGNWSLDLPDVDPGTYTLTVAQLSPDGDVISQVDTPFLREDPERVSSSPMSVEAGVSVITVQPGFTLWGIAEANFGEGIAYVQIFDENRDSIRDPDWIFPGQIFRLPDLPRAGDAR